MYAMVEFQTLIDQYLSAYERHDAQACASLYAADGKVFSPWGTPVTGTAAICAVHEDWFIAGECSKVMKVFDARADGDTGYCLVRYSAKLPDESSGLQRVFGASLNTLTRQADGQWKSQPTSINELENEEAGFTK